MIFNGRHSFKNNILDFTSYKYIILLPSSVREALKDEKTYDFLKSFLLILRLIIYTHRGHAVKNKNSFERERKMKSARPKDRWGGMLTLLVLALGLMVWLTEVSEAAPVGTAFTYQGHLYDANYVANGLYDFQFKLFDDPCTGSQLSNDVNKPDVDVIDGYFTVELDFGGSVFDGDARWLEIGVRPGEMNDPCEYTVLSPRQEVTPTPYALYAKNSAGDSDWMISGNDMYSIPSGNVGIGTTTPSAPLTIQAGVGPDLKFVTTGSNADIMSDAELRVGTSSALNFHIITGDLYRMIITGGGDVGIGTTSPAGILEVSHDGSSNDLIVDSSTGNIGIGTTPNSSYKLTANTSSDATCGRFVNWATSTYATGVSGLAQGPGGTNHYGVYGYAYGGTNNWAGYFNGRLYAEAAGIGTESPQETLDVDGTVRMTGFKMTNSPASGYVLTSDATGQGSWQAPTEFSLPYSGSTSSTSRGFSVTKTAGGDGIYAETSGSGNSALYGYVSGVGGKGVYGRAVGDSIYGGYFSASVHENGRGVTGYGGRYGGFFSGDIFGVYGFGSDVSEAQNYGGFFIASGSEGKGACGNATDSNDVANYGGYFSARGWRGYGVYGEAESATGVNYGVYGKTNSTSGFAGYFEGNVKVDGEIKKTVSGGTMERATPIAYAFINSDGSVQSGTPNVSCTWTGTRYEITISGESYFYNTYVTVVTLSGDTGVARTDSSGGMLVVNVCNLSGVTMQSRFQFITYKP